MFHAPYSRRNKTSQSMDKQLLKKLYNQQNLTQQQMTRLNMSIDQKDRILKDRDDLSIVTSNNENYSHEEINRTYKILCSNSPQGVIDAKSLAGFLYQQGEDMYTGVEMVALLDQNKKGYVSIQQFFNFFQKGTYQTQPQIPDEMKKKAQLIKTVDKHYDGLLKNFQDPEYCEYAAKQIKRFKYSEQL